MIKIILIIIMYTFVFHSLLGQENNELYMLKATNKIRIKKIATQIKYLYVVDYKSFLDIQGEFSNLVALTLPANGVNGINWAKLKQLKYLDRYPKASPFDFNKNNIDSIPLRKTNNLLVADLYYDTFKLSNLSQNFFKNIKQLRIVCNYLDTSFENSKPGDSLKYLEILSNNIVKINKLKLGSDVEFNSIMSISDTFSFYNVKYTMKLLIRITKEGLDSINNMLLFINNNYNVDYYFFIDKNNYHKIKVLFRNNNISNYFHVYKIKRKRGIIVSLIHQKQGASN